MERRTNSPAAPVDRERSAPSLAGPRLESPDFAPGARIPKRHASAPEGDDVAPRITWAGVPAGAEELVLIVDDPDAPRAKPWVHWVVHGISGDATGLRPGSEGFVEGPNDFGKQGWGGPLPPEGHGEHRYRFRLYALKERLRAGPDTTKDDLLAAMRGRVLGEAEVVGTYSR